MGISWSKQKKKEFAKKISDMLEKLGIALLAVGIFQLNIFGIVSGGIISLMSISIFYYLGIGEV